MAKKKGRVLTQPEIRTLPVLVALLESRVARRLSRRRRIRRSEFDHIVVGIAEKLIFSEFCKMTVDRRTLEDVVGYMRVAYMMRIV